MDIPKTSVMLLTAIANSSETPRWYEFYDRYQPMMATFLRRFPYLNADDVIQDAMLVFIKKIPDYQYDPNTKGHFHSYLLSILRYKALEALRRVKRDHVLAPDFQNDSIGPEVTMAMEEYNKAIAEEKDEFHATCAELAIMRFLKDESISMRDREIFKRIRRGESPESIAIAYGVTRNNIDQIKARTMKRIRMIAEDIENLNG